MEIKEQKKWYMFEIIVAVITVVLILAVAAIFVCSRIITISTVSWVRFWKWYSFVLFFYSIPITVWFLIGSIIDVKRLFKKLQSEKVNNADDGQIKL